MAKEILLGLTTTKGSDWRKKIADIDTFGIKKIALFLTGLEQDDRQDLYRLLEASQLEMIPHAHIRDDVELWELDYLIERYRTVAFNIHPEKHYGWRYDYAQYPGMIFIENAGMPLKSEMERYPGLCLDFTHWENRVRRFAGQEDKTTDLLLEYIAKYPIGCCHVSAIKPEPVAEPTDANDGVMYDTHYFDDVSELEYMKNYVGYLPQFISLELENSFADQLKAKEYLEKLLALD